MSFTPITNEDRLNLAAERLADAFALLGADMENPHFKDTPKRVAKMYQDILTPNEPVSYTLFENEDPNSQMIIVRDINFVSWCSHHFLPFLGKAHVGYIPNKSIVGLSKIARCVVHHSKNPQVQERLVKDIGDELNDKLKPKGLAVLLEAEHTCMSCRGVMSPASVTQTCKLWGEVDKFEFFETLKMKTFI